MINHLQKISRLTTAYVALSEAERSLSDSLSPDLVSLASEISRAKREVLLALCIKEKIQA